MAARSVLIVEHEPAVRSALSEVLALEPGLAATECATIAEAERMLERVDLLVLSIEHDAAAALAFRRRLRCENARAGLLLLVPPALACALDTALAAEPDQAKPEDTPRVEEVLVKPVRVGLLLSRLRRLLRDLPDLDEDPVPIGPYQFHPAQRVLQEADRRIRLTEKEAAILLHLHRAAGPVERQVLLNEVWGYNDQVSTHTLETHIYKLRQKIEANPSDASLLLTEGGGYRLAGLA